MENIQTKDFRLDVQESFPKVANSGKMVSGLQSRACCETETVIWGNSVNSGDDSVDENNQITSSLKNILRWVTEFNLRNLYRFFSLNDKKNGNQLPIGSNWKGLPGSPQHRSKEFAPWDKIDTLTQFTMIYPFFYKI